MPIEKYFILVSVTEKVVPTNFQHTLFKSAARKYKMQVGSCGLKLFCEGIFVNIMLGTLIGED